MSVVIEGIVIVFIFLACAVVAGVGGLLFFIARGGQKERFRALFDYVALRNFKLADSELPSLLALSPFAFARAVHTKGRDLQLQGLADIHEFSKASLPSAVDGFLFGVGSRMATLFRHSYGPKSGEGSRVHLKCAALPNQTACQFRLTRKTLATSFVGQVLSLAGFRRRIEFVDASVFAKQYELSVDDDASEAAARAYFNAERRSYFEKNLIKGELVAGRDSLIYLEVGTFSDDSSYDAFVDNSRVALGGIIS